MKKIKLDKMAEYFEVIINENKHLCTIKNTGKDEYYAYNERGAGVSVLKLDTIDIIELMTTGSIDRHDIKVNSFADFGSLF